MSGTGRVVDEQSSVMSSVEKWFAATVDAPGAVRRFVRQAGSGWAAKTVQLVELLASELATNAVVHAQTPFLLRLSDAAMIRVAVIDYGGGRPRVQRPAPTDLHGRGLWMVSHLANRWGIRKDGTVTEVWLELDGPSR